TKAFKLFWIQIFYFFVSHGFSECFTLLYIISSYFCRRSNDVLWQEKRRIFMKELEDAYKDQANDPESQEEISVWDIAVGDGLNA
ncbi:MAG: hypothetical protein EWV49_19435, partial [Microcystis aeruginosa Ma_QC_Ch_20071001_S25]